MDLQSIRWRYTDICEGIYYSQALLDHGVKFFPHVMKSGLLGQTFFSYPNLVLKNLTETSIGYSSLEASVPSSNKRYSSSVEG
jgi:hypothetical protein